MWIEKIIGDLGAKKRWRGYKARVAQLPADYRDAAKGVERYLMSSGAVPGDGDRLVTMFDDLADLFEQAAADGTPIREIVGADPVEFAETFAATYSDGGWAAKVRERLARDIDRAAGPQADTAERDGEPPR